MTDQRRIEAERIIQDLTGGTRPDDRDVALFTKEVGWVFRNISGGECDCEPCTFSPTIGLIVSARLDQASHTASFDTVLTVADLADPTVAPSILGRVEFDEAGAWAQATARPGFVALTLDEVYAFVVSDGAANGIDVPGREAWFVVDLSDPTSPTVINDLNWANDAASDLPDLPTTYIAQIFYDTNNLRLYMLVRNAAEVAMSDDRTASGFFDCCGLICYDVSDPTSPQFVFGQVLEETGVLGFDMDFNSRGDSLFVIGTERRMSTSGGSETYDQMVTVSRYDVDFCPTDPEILDRQVLTFRGRGEMWYDDSARSNFGGGHWLIWDEINSRVFTCRREDSSSSVSIVEEWTWEFPGGPRFEGEVYRSTAGSGINAQDGALLGGVISKDGNYLYLIDSNGTAGNIALEILVIDVSDVGAPENATVTFSSRTTPLSNGLGEITEIGSVWSQNRFSLSPDCDYLYTQSQDYITVLNLVDDPTTPYIASQSALGSEFSKTKMCGTMVGIAWGVTQTKAFCEKPFWIGKPPKNATGGAITDDGGYRYHVFSAGDGTFDCDVGGRVEALLIGGGGGGGSGVGGGGGAGGLLYIPDLVLPTGETSIHVGAGGGGGAGGVVLGGQTEGPPTDAAVGTNGDETYIGRLAWVPGGGGGGAGCNAPTSHEYHGQYGGSGGGNGGEAFPSHYPHQNTVGNGNGGFATTGPPSEGYRGGKGVNSTLYREKLGAGGGGAGANGANGITASGMSARAAGAGGAGVEYSQFSVVGGSPAGWFGGGGGGAVNWHESVSTGAMYVVGAGGTGGGGSGGNDILTPGDGVDGTGGGGGGGGAMNDELDPVTADTPIDAADSSHQAGGAGGDGIVILRYPYTP